jgi:hypothetical protein
MMRKSWKVYTVASGVLTLSFVTAWTLPTTEILRGIISLPGVGALLAVLYQIVRDQAAHERALELIEKQHLFNLGTTSHMANVAFDKHVQFSEQYITKMQQGLTELFQNGPTKESLKFYGDLVDIRRSFLAWITKDLKGRITPFEDALYKIGASNIILDSLPVGEARSREVEQMYQIFSDVLGLPKEKVSLDERVAPERILSHLQHLLGVEHLSRLRAAVIKQAIDTLESKNA